MNMLLPASKSNRAPDLSIHPSVAPNAINRGVDIDSHQRQIEFNFKFWFAFAALARQMRNKESSIELDQCFEGTPS